MNERSAQGWTFFALLLSTVFFFIGGMVAFAHLDVIMNNDAGGGVVAVLTLSLVLIFVGWIAWASWVHA